MNSETKTQNPTIKIQKPKPKHLNRLKVAAAILTVLGIMLFSYLVYSVGLENILVGISKIGIGGFLILQLIYFLRIIFRAIAWRLSVYAPYKLDTTDTIPAVIIGEAMSSIIPLGILVSGTAKAVAVRKKVPLVVGLSSIATENIFYSLITGVFICLGAFTFLRSFDLSESWIFTIDLLIGGIIFFMISAIVIVIKQWHFASNFCEFLYDRNIAKGILESGRLQVRLFENLDLRLLSSISEAFSADLCLPVRFSHFGSVRGIIYFKPSARRNSEFSNGVSARINEPFDFRYIQIRAVRHRN